MSRAQVSLIKSYEQPAQPPLGWHDISSAGRGDGLRGRYHTYPLLDVVGGVRIRSESNSLFLTADSLQQGLVQRIALIDEVSQVDSYLLTPGVYAEPD